MRGRVHEGVITSFHTVGSGSAVGYDNAHEVKPQESSKYTTQIMAKDESVFDNFEHLDIKKYWTPDLSDATKNAIWQYLQTLNILGLTITTIPADMLSMVEGVASKCAEGIANGNDDPAAMMSSMSGLMGMLAGGGAFADTGSKKKLT